MTPETISTFVAFAVVLAWTAGVFLMGWGVGWLAAGRHISRRLRK